MKIFARIRDAEGITFDGCERRHRGQSFLAQVADEEVFGLEEADGVLAGRIAGELDRTGRPIGAADSMIAAIALQRGLELVTGNTAHFQRVQQIGDPLRLANWRQ